MCRIFCGAVVSKSVPFHCTCQHYCNTAYAVNSPKRGFYEYSSVVGYMGKDLVDGKCATCASFVNITTKDGVQGVYLTQFIPEGADEITDEDNTVEVQTLGPTGKSTSFYTYHKGDARPYKRDGWYNDENELIGEDIDDVFFPLGTGLWMTGTKALKFTSSGQVLLDSQMFNLVDGKRLVANPFPSKIKLSQLIPEGADEITDEDNTVEVQTLGPTGKSTSFYTYHKGDARPYKRDGWYNDENELIGEDTDDVEYDAGVSLWTTGTKALTLTIVTPFEDAE